MWFAKYLPIIALLILIVFAVFVYKQSSLRPSQVGDLVDKVSIPGDSTGSVTTTKPKFPLYSGTVLAGSNSPLLDFNKSDYDSALDKSKLVVLYFYANWCPICKEEFPKAEKAFDELASSEVVGFRVNFNDNDTDSTEKQLAKEFGIAYQHTKVFVKNGVRVLKSPESWEKDRYAAEISSYLAN